MRTGHVIEILKSKQGDRSLREMAEEYGVSAAYLSDLFNGKREPGKKILGKLNLVKSVKVTRDVEYRELKRERSA